MSAYVYGNIEVHDLALYEQYRAQVPAMVAAHGGRYLVRGGAVEVLEGEGTVQRQVILEFPDMAALKAFYFVPGIHRRQSHPPTSRHRHVGGD